MRRMPKTPEEQERPGLSSLQIGLLVLLVAALLGSVGWRFYAQKKGGAAGGGPAGANGLVDGSAEGKDGQAPGATPLERSLPYVTEGSFFGLIGFALGYASRKFVKVGLILVALFFVGLQALVWTGTVSVDWSGMVGKLNALLFNLQENETMTQFLARRVPSAGGMLAGYLVGFQRG
jgi:uncharacterized membrane protein (Fun14 family)